MQRVRVPTGMSASTLADTLAARGLLRHRTVMLVGARLTGQGHRLQAGLFEVPPGLPVRELVTLFTKPGLPPARVTIPEGLDAGQTARLLAGELGFSTTAFLDAANRATGAAWKRGGLERPARHRAPGQRVGARGGARRPRLPPL